MDFQKLIFIVLNELHGASEQHSCIMAGAVLPDVLRAKGIKDAYPLTVNLKIFNPELTARIKDESLLSKPELFSQLKSDDGAIVTIGDRKGSANQWPAHLIVVIPKALKGRDALCDLTITQASVPDWGINLAPVMVGIRESFIDGSELLGVIMNGCQVVYKAIPEDYSYKQTPIWKKRLKRERIVKRVLKRL